jgi:tetratricopeptide (TPR) repeat protein/O-antigen ligase
MKMNKILRYFLIGGIFIVPFVALLVSGKMFFPFITGKNFAFRILVELLLGGWAILAVLDKAYRPRFSPLLIAVFAFLGIMTLADFFGANPFKSFWSNFERMEGLLGLIHLAGYFVVAGIVLNTEKLWDRFFNTSVAVSTIIGVYGLLQLAGKITINQGGVRLDATFGNASYLAIYMLFHIFITVFLFVRWRGASFVKYLYGAIIILQLAVLYFTATRGAILGLVGGALLTTLLISIFEKEKKTIRKISIIILAFLIAFTGIFVIIKDADFIKKSDTLGRLSSISLKEGSTRFTIWSMAWEGVKERPLLGWGQENFNFVFNKYYKPSLYAQEQWFDRVHNIFFDWLIAGGILGFFAYFSIPFLMLYYLWRRLEVKLSVTEKSILTGLLAGYFFHNMFVFDNIMSYILFFSIGAYIYAHSTFRPNLNEDKFKSDLNRNNGMRRVFIPLIIIAVIFSLYFFNIKGIFAARSIIRGISPQSSFDVNIANLEKALAYNTVGKQEAIEQMAVTALRMKNIGADIETQTKFFEPANREMGKLVEERSEDARIRIFYASLLNNFNFHGEALPHLKKAVELSPNKQAMHFELGTAYLNKGEFEKAFDIFEEAYNLAPDFKDAEIIYRVGSIYVGREAEINSIIGPISDNDRTDTRIINAYVRTNRFDEVVKSWEITVANNPNNAQSHLSLGASYLQIGRRQDAIAEIQKAIDLDENFREQGEFYINEIRAGRNP